MKILSILSCFLISALCASAADIQLSVASVRSNTVATVADEAVSTYQQNGYVYSVELNVSGYASPTVDVDVVTVTNANHKVQKTLLSMDSVTANGLYRPIVYSDSTSGVEALTNAPARIKLTGEKVKLVVYKANTNGTITVDAKIDLE